MIRQLNAADSDMVMKLVKKECELNLFIIGDIENYGYENDFQKLLGEFDENGELTAVLLKYYSSFVLYSRFEYDAGAFYNIMLEHDFKVLSGETSIISRFKGLHSFSKKKNFYLCKLDSLPVYDDQEKLESVAAVDPDKVETILGGLLELYSHVKEFDAINRDEMKRKLEDKTGRAYYIMEGGRVVAAAQTSAENSTSAMVVAVGTNPDYRQRGYASACVARLCRDLISQGKSLCLFYNNPDAGRIYKRLGFTDIGLWTTFNR